MGRAVIVAGVRALVRAVLVVALCRPGCGEEAEWGGGFGDERGWYYTHLEVWMGGVLIR